MLKIYIGPNGYGKTTTLNSEKDSLISSGVPENEILFLESEILLMDEVKDTKDESKTMEFIIQEILMTSPKYVAAKTALEKQIQSDIIANQSNMNTILSDILSINGSLISTGTNFIDKNSKMTIKNLVKIDSKEIKNKTGSGQRMQLILKLIENSKTKKYVFIDEPEKYSHPSLLHKTAEIIRNLDANGINVYIATHSPKLVSMLNISFDNLFIINDSTHIAKNIDFDGVLSSLSLKCISSMNKKDKSFYIKSELINNIMNVYYREFIEALFSTKVYLCEGINDKFFVLKALKTDGLFYDDCFIFQTFGKFVIPVFEKIFSSLGILTEVFFDEDTSKRTSDPIHQEIDSYLETLNHYKFVPCLESELGFPLKDKQNTFSFIEYLDSFIFTPKKYIK